MAVPRRPFCRPDTGLDIQTFVTCKVDQDEQRIALRADDVGDHGHLTRSAGGSCRTDILICGADFPIAGMASDRPGQGAVSVKLTPIVPGHPLKTGLSFPAFLAASFPLV